MKINKILIIYMRPKFAIENETILEVINTLKKNNLKYKIVERSMINKKICCGYDLIIVIGGDGTFLRASHFIDDTLVLGVNSNIARKEGFLMQLHKANFAEKFGLLIKGKFKLLKIDRLQTILRKENKDIHLPLSLNEVFIGHKLPYQMSRYIIYFKNKKEFQKSSGIIIGTPIGSHAWIASAGGKKLPITSNIFQFIVREPYQGRLHENKLIHDYFTTEKLVITAESSHIIITVDSLSEEFAVLKNDQIIIKQSKMPLQYISFS